MATETAVTGIVVYRHHRTGQYCAAVVGFPANLYRKTLKAAIRDAHRLGSANGRTRYSITDITSLHLADKKVTYHEVAR